MGFLSLSQEILWVRFTGFAYRSAPQAFSFVLGTYLLGIAGGAGLGKRLCRNEDALVANAGRVLLLAGLLDLVMPWIAVLAFGTGKGGGTVVLALVVMTTSLLKSAIFPIAHHLGSPTGRGRVGSSVSKVYFANIVGSFAGPLVTGFGLLQLLSLQQSLALMGSMTLAVGLLCLGTARVSNLATVSLAAGGALCGTLLLPGRLLPTLIGGTVSPEFDGPLKLVVENRSGIIHVNSASSGGDYILGNNGYDGRTSIDFVLDSNGISRAYILSVLRPRPAHVLVIGLSGGAWTRVLSAFPGVERIDVVEINPGYLQVIRSYPDLAAILSDARVRIHIDDGRRWLKRHPEERFDLIMMNTTMHWRAYTTLLLSREFHALARAHLNPHGVFAYNGTSSYDAFKTATTVFPFVHGYSSLVIASDYDPKPGLARGLERLSELRLDGHPLLDMTRPEVLAKAQRVLGEVVTYEQSVEPAGRPLEVITDQNMIPEYRYGKSLHEFLLRGWAR